MTHIGIICFSSSQATFVSKRFCLQSKLKKFLEESKLKWDILRVYISYSNPFFFFACVLGTFVVPYLEKI